MQLIDTRIRNLGGRRYRVTLTLATDDPVETASESIVSTVEVVIEEDNPLLSEVQGAALARVREAIARENRAIRDAARPAS